MADNSNYIGVAMGLDVSDLKSGLTEASKRIGEANADFKAAASSMDDWTKSTEGLQAKVKQLDNVLKAQKSKLAGLTAEYEKVAKEQGENSNAARNLYIRMQNQKAVVNQTQREFDNYTETLKQAEAGTLDLSEATLKNGKALKSAGNDANDAGGKLGGLGGVAKGVVGGIAAIGGAAVAVVGSFLSLAESTREVRENFNKLETGFTTAGHTAEDATSTYRELYGLLGDEGQATEAAAHLAQLADNQEDLASWTNIATGVYATFGDSLPIEGLTEAANETAKTGQLTGGLADALNWAGVSEDEFQAKLDAANSEQERAALITDTLNGLYSEQADTYKELNADIIAAREAEANMSQAMAELGAIAEPIMTTLKTLATEFLVAITPAVELIGAGLKGAFEGTEGATETLAQGIGGVISNILDLAMKILPTLLETVVQIIPSVVSTVLGALPQLLDVVADIVVQLVGMLGTLLPQIVAKVIEIVPQLISSLAAAIPQILQAALDFWMSIIAAIPTLISSLVSALPTIIETIITALVEAKALMMNGAVQLLLAIVQAIPILIETLVQNLPTIIMTILNALLDAIPLLLEGAINLLLSLVRAIPTVVVELVKAIPELVVAIIDALVNFIPQLLDTAITLLMAIIDAIPIIITELIGALPDIYITIIKALLGAIPQLLQAAITLLFAIIKAIPTIVIELVKALPQIIVTIVQAIIGAYAELFGAAKELFFQIIDAIKPFLKELPSKMGEIITKIVEGLKKGISKVKTVGSDIIKGLWNGINDMAGWIGKKIKGFGETVLGGIKDFFGIASPSKLMRDEIGKFIGEGIGVGVLDSIPTVKKQLGQFTGFVSDNLGNIKNGLSLDTSSGDTTSSGARGSTIIDARQTVNFNGSMSRKELHRVRTEHYADVKTRLKAEGAI